MSIYHGVCGLVIASFFVLPLSANAGFFDTKTKKGEGGTEVTELNKCATPIGTAALQEPDLTAHLRLQLLQNLGDAQSKLERYESRWLELEGIKEQQG